MSLVATIGDICTCVFVLYCNRVQRREVVAIIEDRQIVIDKFINLILAIITIIFIMVQKLLSDDFGSQSSFTRVTIVTPNAFLKLS